MRLYVDRYALDAVACRIGSFLDEPGTTRALSTWLSHDDGVRMVEAALTAPSPASRCSTASATTPAPGGTSSPDADSATSRSTMPRRTPTGWPARSR